MLKLEHSIRSGYGGEIGTRAGARRWRSHDTDLGQPAAVPFLFQNIDPDCGVGVSQNLLVGHGAAHNHAE
jgi:hypothetical protein